MRLGTLVGVISLTQALVDVLGILLTLYLPDMSPDINGLSDQVEPPQPCEEGTIKDFSSLHLPPTPLVMTLLPHLFSGVVARMLAGFPCLMAGLLAEQQLAGWREMVEEEQLSQTMLSQNKLSKLSLTRLDLVNTTQTKLETALVRRREECDEQAYRMERVLELVLMVANTSTAFLLVLASGQEKLPGLHIPWMVLSAFEIAGNVCVAVAFLIVPGPAKLVSGICLLKVIWLRWVWARARRQMQHQLNKQDRYYNLMVRDDLVRACLRSKLHDKGKVRLSRVLGSYA